MTEKTMQAETSCSKTTSPATVSSTPPQPRGAERAVPATAVRRASIGAAIVSAFGASLCCIGPLAASALGFTGLGVFVKLHAFRPYLAVLTVLFLVGAVHLTYRKAPAGACAPGSPCEATVPGRADRLNRVVLWTVAVAALLVLSFPTWSGWIRE